MNETLSMVIDDMLDDGRAFGRSGGLAVFVSGGCRGADGELYAGAVPGDTVRAEITKKKKNSAEAVLMDIVSPSPDRAAAECPYFAECGGCTLQELSYEAQLRLKRDQVKAKLERLGGLTDPKVNDTIGAEALRYYRNKAAFAVGPHGEVGFKKAKSHFVMDIDDCMLQTDAAMVCADALRAFLRENPDVQKNAFPICGMTVKTALGTGEVMAVLETESRGGADRHGRGKKNDKKRKGSEAGGAFDIPHIEMLAGMFDDAVSSLNERAEADDRDEEKNWSLESIAVINGNKCRVIAGKPSITEEFRTGDGRCVSFEISPQSFFQVNPGQMAKLYDKTAEYAGLSKNAISEMRSDNAASPENVILSEAKDLNILDIYCGAGTIGIWLLDRLRSENPGLFERARVIGIESVKPAVIDANRNSVINGLVNTRYICGRAEEELPGMMGMSKLYKWNEVNERVEREPEMRIGFAGSNAEHADSVIAEKVDIAVLDPPRAGCGEALLAAVAQAAPDRIVYVSCDPGTLARDIKYLTAHGYEFIEATPVDQFPWTSHIEVVANIQRR